MTYVRLGWNITCSCGWDDICKKEEESNSCHGFLWLISRYNIKLKYLTDIIDCARIFDHLLYFSSNFYHLLLFLDSWFLHFLHFHIFLGQFELLIVFFIFTIIRAYDFLEFCSSIFQLFYSFRKNCSFYQKIQIFF